MDRASGNREIVAALAGWADRWRRAPLKPALSLLAWLAAFRVPLFSWTTAYALLWCYRALFSVLGEVVIMRLTIVSDTRSYQRQELWQALDLLAVVSSNIGFLMQATATALTKLVGLFFGLLSFNNPIFINLGFQTIGFLGLLALLRALEPTERKVFFGLLLLPSITVWSSIASKEALLVGFVGVVCAHIVKIYKNEDRINVVTVLCVILVGVFKPHYMPALLLLIGVSYAARYSPQKATIALLALIASLLVLYVLRDPFDDFATYVDYGITALGGNSVRPRFLVEQYDVFFKAPLGMYLAFAGPTLSEASRGILHMVTFTETVVIIFVLLFFLIRRLPEVPAFNFILSMSALFWILFATYPPAVSNPGTAIRYRTGYILIVFLCFVLMLSRPLYVNWVRGWRVRPRRRLWTWGREPTAG